MKTVIFIVCLQELFNGIEYLYNFMKKDNNFNPNILIIPNIDRRLKNKKNSDFIEYLNKMNYNLIVYNDKFDIKKLNPDYIFYERPFVELFPNKLHPKYLKNICKLCYFSYGYTIFDKCSINIFSDTNILLKYLDYIFIENEFVYNNYKNIIDNRFKITGHPKVNYLVNKNISKNTNKIKNILWCPRWMRKCSNYSNYLDYFIELSRNKNVNITIRFHPLDQHNKDNLFLKLKKYKTHIKIDNNNMYDNTFKNTDIFVSDLSTMIPEFIPTGKPIIYTEHKDNIPNKFMNELEKCIYKVRNKYELEKEMNNLLIDDILFDNRINIINKYYNKYNSCENICNILKN